KFEVAEGQDFSKDVYKIQWEDISISESSGNASACYKMTLKMGDLVFFCIKGGKVSHVGIYLKDGFFVHASTRAGVIVSNLGESYYKKYFCRAGRYL
ncbi:MAG: NlpC/P60 family protein, partial [Bacteroidota bacterium]